MPSPRKTTSRGSERALSSSAAIFSAFLSPQRGLLDLDEQLVRERIAKGEGGRLTHTDKVRAVRRHNERRARTKVARVADLVVERELRGSVDVQDRELAIEGEAQTLTRTAVADLRRDRLALERCDREEVDVTGHGDVRVRGRPEVVIRLREGVVRLRLERVGALSRVGRREISGLAVVKYTRAYVVRRAVHVLGAAAAVAVAVIEEEYGTVPLIRNNNNIANDDDITN